MKICFLARAMQTPVFIEMAKYLAHAGYESVFVTQNDTDDKRIRAQIPDAQIYNITGYLEKNWDAFTYEKLCEYTKKYSDVNIWEIYYTDRFLPKHFGYADAVHFIAGHFAFYEEVFDKERPDVFVDEPITTFGSYVAYYICPRFSVRFLSLVASRRSDKSTVYYSSVPACTMPELQNCPEPAEADLKMAREYIEKYVSEKSSPSYMKVNRLAPRLKPRHWLFPVREFVQGFQKRFNNKFDYTYFNYHHTLASPFYMYWRYRASLRYFKKPDLNCKYYLFPLHVYPEASIMIACNKYSDQTFAVEQLAKSIPGDAVLYVKEHPAAMGTRPTSFYKALQKFPNVDIIDPYVDIHGMIKNCHAVITLTSTIGLDALFYEKPVFVLGDVFYERCKGVQKLDDIFNHMESLKNPEPAERGEVVLFVAKWLTHIYDGSSNVGDPNVTNPENIKRLSERLIEEIKAKPGTGHG